MSDLFKISKRPVFLAKEEDITWAKAILGDWCWPPEYFKAGNGAWGCHQSHLRVVQEAIMDGVENYLILEDDACFYPDTVDHLLDQEWK